MTHLFVLKCCTSGTQKLACNFKGLWISCNLPLISLWEVLDLNWEAPFHASVILIMCLGLHLSMDHLNGSKAASWEEFSAETSVGHIYAYVGWSSGQENKSDFLIFFLRKSPVSLYVWCKSSLFSGHPVLLTLYLLCLTQGGCTEFFFLESKILQCNVSHLTCVVTKVDIKNVTLKHIKTIHNEYLLIQRLI